MVEASVGSIRQKGAAQASTPLRFTAYLIAVLIPELGAILGSIGALVVYCGGAVLLVQIGRDLGRSLEGRLYQSWGGKPSAAMLRHADSRLPKPTKDRYRSFLSRAVPGLSLASDDTRRRRMRALSRRTLDTIVPTVGCLNTLGTMSGLICCSRRI